MIGETVSLYYKEEKIKPQRHEDAERKNVGARRAVPMKNYIIKNK